MATTRAPKRAANGRGPVPAADIHSPGSRSIQARGIPATIHEAMTGYYRGANLGAGQFLVNLWELRERLVARGENELLEEVGLAPLSFR